MFTQEKRGPDYLGRTFAVGFCVGAFFLYGQTLLCIAVWLVMDRWLKRRFSVLIASLLTFISNPLTTPFILYLYYMTGQALLGNPAVPFSSFLIQAKIILTSIDTSNLSEVLRLLGIKFGCPIALGSLPWHIIMAFIGYNAGIRAYWKLHKILEKKKQLKTGCG
jgi:uncharacterized protein (DUF2062 family)